MSLSARSNDRDFLDCARPSRTRSSTSFLTGAAFALVCLSGGWTAHHYLLTSTTTPEMASVSDRINAMGSDLAAIEEAAFVAANFAERFAPVPRETAVAATTATTTVIAKKKNVYVALLDPTYSLGSTPDRFALRPTSSVVPDAKVMGAEKADEALQSRTPTQLALSIPVPAARPSDARLSDPRSSDVKPPLSESRAPLSKNAFSHDALVQRARIALSTAKPSNASIFDKLFGNATPAPTVLAYAGSDGGVMSDGSDSTAAKPGLYDRTTAVYDISKRMVYMPDGSKLEAHSGLGQHLDNPAYAHLRMRGVTPPHIYDLKPREALFHGVAALRLTPVGGENAIYGRTGLLAHTYMLGPNGDSNGCVSFKDYNAFLRAYRNGDVKRLIVVAKMD
jgi:hypothetical protein